MSIVLENAATAVRRELDKALVRRKNVKHYIWVATFAANPETAQKNLDKYLPEIGQLDIKIKELQDRLADIKAQLREMGIAFTIKATKPLTTRKSPPPRGINPKGAIGKISFTPEGQVSEEEAKDKTPEEIEQLSADRAMAKAFTFIADLMQRGYKFNGKKGSPVVRNNVHFHGVYWYETPGSKLFFYTTRPDVFRTYSVSK